MFSWFRKPKQQFFDYTPLHNDLHSHLLPGVDDGSQALDETIEMLKAFRMLGYRKVYTSPHIKPSQFPNQKQDLLSRFEELKVQLASVQGLPEIELAAEYFLDEHFLPLVHRNELLPVAGRYVLVETAHNHAPVDFETIVKTLRSAGYFTILAHPERYSYAWGRPEIYQQWVDMGVLLQVNLNSFTSRYRKEIQKAAALIAQKEWAAFVGSDAHRMEHLDGMSSALKNPALQKLMASGRLLNPTL